MNTSLTVLHLCSDFAKQTVYPQLVSHLARTGVAQEVYVPVRTQAEAEWTPPEVTRVTYHLRHILRPEHRLFFRTKIRTVFRDVCSQVRLSDAGVAHAHFLYSDGAVALRLWQRFGIPYVVALRNTDINVFMRFRPDLRWLMAEIVREARKIVFLSPAYERALRERLGSSVWSLVEAKATVIPNGIASAWLASSPKAAPESEGPLRLLYVGDFSRNKNLPGLLEAVSLVTRTSATSLTLVGGGGDGEPAVRRMLQSGRYAFAQYAGRIEDPDRLRAVYRAHDLFVMPSFRETFGMVFLEALSQGLPIIHSRGQGVDGYFEPGTVSEAVDPSAPADIAEKILLLASRMPRIRQACVDQAKRFEWRRIAQSYRELYVSIARPSPEDRS